MNRISIVIVLLAILMNGCGKADQRDGQYSQRERDPRNSSISLGFTDRDSITGYAAYARYDSIDDKIISPVVVMQSYQRIKDLVKSGKLPDRAMVYPRIEGETIIGMGSRYTGKVGEVILYNHISDSFLKIGKLQHIVSSSDGTFPFKDELEPILNKAVPEEDRRDWIQRWQAGPLANGCEIIEVVHMAPGESKEFSIPRSVPTWIGFLIEEASAVSKDSGRITLYKKENVGKCSGYPVVKTVSRPVDGALQFSIVNETEISTHVAVFIDTKREVKASIP